MPPLNDVRHECANVIRTDLAGARSGHYRAADGGLLHTLRFRMTRAFDADAVRAAMRGDKKRRDGRQRWILPMAIGSVTEVDDVTDAELRAALRAIGE